MSSGLADDELPNQLSSVDDRLAAEIRQRSNLWRSNYHEASIFIEEGLNNDKFENHPRKRATKLAVQLGNNTNNSNNNNNNNSIDPGISGGGGNNNNRSSTSVTSIISDDPNQSHNTTAISNNPNASPSASSLQDQHLNQQHHNYPANKPHDESSSSKLSNGSMSSSYLDRRKKNGYLQYTTIETYILVHNRYFYQLDLAASVILLMLALFEPPAVDGYQLNPTVHAAIEMFALGIIAIELILKFRWMGPRRFFRHGRTVVKLIVLLTMNCEAIVIFLRHSIHARYSRAFRPIFLIDNHYCHGLRRAVRQIFQSLPPIIDMFTLVMFFMFVFSIFGFYLFAANNSNFSDMPGTMGNLLILATTASLPDVMMPSYAVSRWSAMFFVLFVIIHLFLFTNLTMAAVYETFTRKEKEKFHKLLLHRRKACQEAFKLLVSRREPNKIQYKQFMGLMRYLNRKCSMFDAYLIFKALDTDKSGSISLEEFYQIYDYINLEWRLVYPAIRWYDDCELMSSSCRSGMDVLRRFVTHRFFDWTIDLLIAAQAALQFIEASAFKFNLPTTSYMMTTTILDTPANITAAAAATNFTETLAPNDLMVEMDEVRPDSFSTYIFIATFSVETILRLMVMGFSEYWRNRWNRFDLAVLLVSIIGLTVGNFGYTPFGWVIVLRVMRLMRLFEFKRRYKDMWQTLTYILAKRFVGMTCVVMILYYFFAIIGMELLGDYDLRNCCKNTSLESQFKFDNSTEGAKYYLNDFGDLIASYLTLFSMTSNTYWLATMSAYAIVSGSNWTRVFFGIYYLCSIIVMNIVVAFILESFLFHIQYRSRMGDNCDNTNLFTVFVTLSSDEVDFLRVNLRSYNCVKHLDKIANRMEREMEEMEARSRELDEEKQSLLGKSPGRKISSMANQKIVVEQMVKKLGKEQKVVRVATPSTGGNGGGGKGGNKSQLMVGSTKLLVSQRRPWYLIYQAEQIRNKFSFTMKMYADEVEGWLAEAERADQDEISSMISRNQIRAEHVAMARLVRRNFASVMEDNPIIWPRARSYSSGGDLLLGGVVGGQMGSGSRVVRQRESVKSEVNLKLDPRGGPKGKSDK